MSDAGSTEEQLMLLKGMTVRTGAIHEAQRLQLVNWPRLSKKIKSAVVKVSVESKTVIIECKSATKKYVHGQFEQRLFDEICGWTRRILWDETKVVIKVNGKRLFDSTNQ